MQLDALERQSIPDTDAMSLTYLPDGGNWTITSPVQSPVEANNSEQSPVEATKPPVEAKNSKQSPVEAQIINESPITCIT